MRIFEINETIGSHGFATIIFYGKIKLICRVFLFCER
jgi:hypothetical protein